jgi:protease IV
MKQFFKFMLASMLGNILLMLLFILFFGAIIASFSKDSEVKIADNSMMVLKLDKPIPDRTPVNPFESFDFSTFENTQLLGLDKYLKAITLAKDDDRIKGIYIDVTPMPAGFATLNEIREKLLDFKESGKFIIAYGEVFDQKAYFISSVADTVILNPEGMLDFRGLASEAMFLKGMLAKLDIEPQVLRGPDNKYKSAVEPLILDQMSPSNREQVAEYLGDLWNYHLTSVGASRKLSIDSLNMIADQLKIRTADDAAENGLIDWLAYKDEVISFLKTKLGIADSKDIETICPAKYLKVPRDGESRRGKKKIAVIYASGEIGGGEGDDSRIGSDRISQAIREARRDSTIKAVVLRVNSPGGSALASEVIWREVNLTREVKPIVVSMGDLAASGGYYISCAASKIYANPNTLTGSIGVFGVIPNMQGFFKNKLGITFDTVKTNAHSDYMTVARPLEAFEIDAINESVTDIYNTFIAHVAEGRKMDPAMVDSIAKGRVWSGMDAKEIGLVDELGGLDDAIAAAAKLAGVEDYRVTNLPEQKEFLEEIMAQFNTKAQLEAMLKSKLGPSNYALIETMESLSRARGVQARLPFILEIY